MFKFFDRWRGNAIFEFFKVVIISLLIIIPVRSFLMEPFYVKGSSMEPNFYSYDYLLINKLKYNITDPQRNDIVVAKFSDKSPYVIKRIIGLPNETVEIKDKKIKITDANGNSFDLEEIYLDPNNVKNEMLTFKIPADKYLLLGDNRKVSYDSRQQGPISIGGIKGKVMLKVLNFGPIIQVFNSII